MDLVAAGDGVETGDPEDNHKMNSSRAPVAGSSKRRIPSVAVPTAPIQFHTAQSRSADLGPH